MEEGEKGEREGEDRMRRRNCKTERRKFLIREPLWWKSRWRVCRRRMKEN